MGFNKRKMEDLADGPAGQLANRIKITISKLLQNASAPALKLRHPRPFTGTEAVPGGGGPARLPVPREFLRPQIYYNYGLY